MKIGDREIGPGQPPYIIAEASCNHCGHLSTALKLIEAAKSSGADAIKFQAYTADTITIDSDRPDFLIQDGPWQGWRLYDLYRQAETPFGWFPEIFKAARDQGMACFASVFDRSSVDLMVRLNAPAIKIASFELVDTPLVSYAASTGLPLIISTGMASEAEIREAAAVTQVDNRAFLHCVSGYPTPIEESRLWRFNYTRGANTAEWGISDHTMGIEVPVAAAALGATIIEKHFKLNNRRRSADSAFSLEPNEFKRMCDSVRAIWRSIHGQSDSDIEAAHVPLRRSLYVVQDMVAGEVFTNDNVRSIRPGHGLHPGLINQVLGRTASRNVVRGTPMSWDLTGKQRSDGAMPLLAQSTQVISPTGR